MKIGLIDVDGHNFPNLALMKLSAYHKANGDTVDWYEPLFGHYDKVYMSKVFTFTSDYEYFIDADEVIKGGTGYKLYDKVLPEEVDRTFPDYTIYPQYDFAIGFLTRGCIRKCPWCVVPKKEGALKPYCDWKSIKRADSDKIVFMDNNVLASEYGIEQMKSMVGQDVKIDFNQGLDARLITDEIAELLSRLKWISTIRLACDTSQMIPIVEKAVQKLGKYGVKPYRIFVYTLIQDIDEAYQRIKALDKLGVKPFAQPYRDFETNYVNPEHKHLARWCNHKATHYSIPFEEYTG